MVTNYSQEDGTYLFPMELSGRKCEEDRMSREADIKLAKHKGYRVDWVKFGCRIFEAVLIPVSEENFKAMVRDEDNRQKAARIEGRCPISNGKGGVIRCPERIPNPLYGEEGQPKTLKNDCSTCIYYTYDRLSYATQSLSHSGRYNEDGEEEDLEIPCRIAGGGDIYEMYCEKVLELVKEKFPENLEMMEMLLQEYTRKETAEKLGIHRNTPQNRINSMKEDIMNLLEGMFEMFR